jgi:hypothetical protein
MGHPARPRSLLANPANEKTVGIFHLSLAALSLPASASACSALLSISSTLSLQPKSHPGVNDLERDQSSEARAFQREENKENGIGARRTEHSTRRKQGKWYRSSEDRAFNEKKTRKMVSELGGSSIQREENKENGIGARRTEHSTRRKQGKWYRSSEDRAINEKKTSVARAVALTCSLAAE